MDCYGHSALYCIFIIGTCIWHCLGASYCDDRGCFQFVTSTSRYYLYQWPVTMSVIVVISIFITLCTCTLVMWIRDVLRDYDTQRRRRALRRRQTAATAGAAAAGGNQQQQPQPQQQQQQQGGGGGGGAGRTGQLRRPVMMPRPPYSAAATDLAAGVAPPTRDSEDRATPTPSDFSVSTSATGVQDLTTSSQMGKTRTRSPILNSHNPQILHTCCTCFNER